MDGGLDIVPLDHVRVRGHHQFGARHCDTDPHVERRSMRVVLAVEAFDRNPAASYVIVEIFEFIDC